jgi:penicillin amidase
VTESVVRRGHSDAPPLDATAARSRIGWRPVVAAILLAGLGFIATNAVGPAPAIGPLLDPARGIWASVRGAGFRESISATIPGLDGEVRIIYDRRAVPHIFATTPADAYRALGYVVARDRLFQLEVQTRAAAGTLTEMVGPGALSMDRRMRALGLPRAAERKLAALDTTDPGYRAMAAYSAGVNAWIDGMSAADLPIEFHLLGARPSKWHPINGIHLLNRMGWTLAFSDEELRRVAARARVGAAATDALFPYDSPIQEPIQPTGKPSPRYAFRRLPPPGAPDSSSAAIAAMAMAAAPSMAFDDGGFDDAIGSNNWAVAPSRTAAGRALLAGDPHLDLTLPSIWYEAHMVVPGVLDVYGVTIPGAPSIIIGFNRDVAWTFTNTQADVVDYYAERVDDPASPTRYMLDGSSQPLELRIERYLAPNGSVVAVDTVRYTHRGPMQRTPSGWVSMRWTIFEPSREMGNFIDVARARSVADWMKAMESYIAPAQNMLVADRAGTIAIRSTGVYPIRPGNGRGDVIRDGSTRASDWTGQWPVAAYPQVVNPAQGFVASANQQPIDPLVNATYLGADWFPPWRAMRINQLLRADTAVTVDAMRRYQTDPGSARADAFVPYFLAAARAGPPSDSLARAAALLAEWDRRYTVDNQRAVLFERAMQELASATWDELRPPGSRAAGGTPRPSDMVLLELLQDSTSAWWDIRATASVERRDEIVRTSLLRGLATAVRERGEPEGGGWRWSGIQRARVDHLAGIAAFGAPPVPTQGGPSTLNPSSGDGGFGASWRMVVELGDDVRGWATYPGGQSGNPLSDRYSDRLDGWSKGTLDTLLVPRAASAFPESAVRGRISLVPR